MVYTHDIIKIGNNVVLSLRHIESMSFPDDEQQMVVNALKDDILLNVVMSSGSEHSISIASVQMNNPYLRRADKNELRSAIYDRWCHILKGVV